MARRTAPATIDDYIAACPDGVGSILEKIRALVRTAAPEAEEKISYGMPAFDLDGGLIYFAAFKKHIGIFPPVAGDEKLRKDLLPYRGEKGNLRFPLGEPMPYPLIARVIKCRIKEHLSGKRSGRNRK